MKSKKLKDLFDMVNNDENIEIRSKLSGGTKEVTLLAGTAGSLEYAQIRDKLDSKIKELKSEIDGKQSKIVAYIKEPKNES